tara:strand:+ start:1388 stop:2002 length:615 start_codon:yes stop_codon:yes gene_type:complete
MVNEGKKRILEIAYKNKLGHLSSYLSCYDIIDYIHKIKNADDIFILSCGHASLALYVAIEKHYNINAEKLFEKHGGHPHLNELDKIYCSTGSLGTGITISIGRALANPNRDVYVLISDGECAEGSVWESLRYIKEKNINNIHVFANINGYCAYNKVDKNYLTKRLKVFLPKINIVETTVNQLPFLKGLNAHYHVMSKSDYKSTL